MFVIVYISGYVGVNLNIFILNDSYLLFNQMIGFFCVNFCEIFFNRLFVLLISRGGLVQQVVSRNYQKFFFIM